MYIIDVVISVLAFLLSLLVEKDEKVWLFGARDGSKYCDNPKYLFEWMLNENKVESIYWVTKSKEEVNNLKKNDIPVLYYYNLANIFKLAKCSYIVCSHSPKGSDVLRLINKRVKLVVLWHGIPIKRMGEGYKKRKFNFLKTLPDLFLVTNKNDIEIFSKAFGISKEAFFIGQYPRVINLTDKYKPENIILYAPTFRDNQTQTYYDSIFPNESELVSINNSLEKIGYKFFVKLHPYTKAKFPDVEHCKNISILDKHDDIYTFLKKTKVLITDYSSVYLDCLHTTMSYMFYAPDLEWYENEYNRGVNYEYESVTPGIKFDCWNDFVAVLDSKLISESSDVQSIRKQFYDASVEKAEFKKLYESCKALSLL